MKRHINIKFIFLTIFILFINNISIAQELNSEQIYAKVKDCIVMIYAYGFNDSIPKKNGSGVVISDNGWVVTNYHLFNGCERLKIIKDNILIEYTDIIGVDVERDIMILKIDENIFPAISVGNSNNIKAGQTVYAVGCPHKLQNTITHGITSGLRYDDLKNNYNIQFDASISPGSSGGALVNGKGELIGITTFRYDKEFSQNLNFAIPINDVLNLSLGNYSNKKSIEANNYFYKGLSASENGYYLEAINYYNKFLELIPDNISGLNNRGIAYFNLNNYDSAISDFSKVLEINPQYAIAYNRRACVYSALKEYDNAISDFNKAKEIDSNLIILYYNYGLLYTELKDFEKSLIYYSKAIEKDKSYLSAYNDRGNAYFYLGEYYNAIKDFTKIIELDPNNKLAFYNRGIMYLYLKEYLTAIYNFNEAININSLFYDAYNARGKAYCSIKNFSQSIADYSKAIEIYPNLVSTYINRGDVYYEIKEFKLAILDYSKAIEIDQINCEAYLKRGISYFRSGSINYACKDWQKAYILGSEKVKELIDKYCK